MQARARLPAGLLPLGIPNRPLASQEKPSARASKVEYEGWRHYMVHRARCHGDDAVSGVMAPDLRRSVSSGAVYAYVAARAKGRLPAGRPGGEPARS
jgi:hypothetical protein